MVMLSRSMRAAVPSLHEWAGICLSVCEDALHFINVLYLHPRCLDVRTAQVLGLNSIPLCLCATFSLPSAGLVDVKFGSVFWLL